MILSFSFSHRTGSPRNSLPGLCNTKPGEDEEEEEEKMRRKGEKAKKETRAWIESTMWDQLKGSTRLPVSEVSAVRTKQICQSGRRAASLCQCPMEMMYMGVCVRGAWRCSVCAPPAYFCSTHHSRDLRGFKKKKKQKTQRSTQTGPLAPQNKGQQQRTPRQSLDLL